MYGYNKMIISTYNAHNVSRVEYETQTFMNMLFCCCRNIRKRRFRTNLGPFNSVPWELFAVLLAGEG